MQWKLKIDFNGLVSVTGSKIIESLIGIERKASKMLEDRFNLAFGTSQRLQLPTLQSYN